MDGECHECTISTKDHPHCQSCFILVGSYHLEPCLYEATRWAVYEDLTKEARGEDYYEKQKFPAKLLLCSDCLEKTEGRVAILPQIEKRRN